MTLFELVVVIAVGAVLVLLLLAATRSVVIETKVNRVREEHRQLALALSRYALDYGAPPTADLGLDALARGSRATIGLPMDPFRTGGATYAYLPLPKSEGGGYLLISPGPDGAFDIPEVLLPLVWGIPSTEGLRGPGDPAPPDDEAIAAALQQYLSLHQYDSARSVPSGDVITFVRN